MFIQRILGLGVICAAVALSTGVVSQSTRTTLDLRTGPIINSNEVANLALVLSVEFPTTRAAYPRSSAYSSATQYKGYHDSKTCYGYVGTSTDGYFKPNGATDAAYNCNLAGTGTGFSGNFLNYANTSSIDVLRMSLTGGDRIVDEAPSLINPNPKTILQRAILPSDARTNPNGANRNTNYYRGDTNSTTNFDKIILAAGTQTAAVTPFGSSSQVVVKFCDDKIFFGNTDTGTCLAPANNANLSVSTLGSPTSTVTGTFKARVLVCDASEGPVRKDLCQQQPNGHYKPVGEIQRNADKVRVAAFGYLIDSADWATGSEGSRYGGVLRAPMKFAGPKKKTGSGIVSTNDEAEWDSDTGVFIDKPLDTSNETGYTWSGVINYINRFGRHTRSDGVGIDVYKRRDPVGELHYEAIRYFQAQQPTTQAVSTLTATLNAGYPVYTSWTDPMQNACQRNFAMLVGDNNTSKDGYIPGSTISGQTRSNDTITRTAPDGTSKSVTLNAKTWTDVLTSFETNGSTTYTDSQGVTRTANGNATSGATGVQSGSPYNALSTTTFSDAASYLYAGVAYWANTQSIRPDKPLARVRTYVLDVDEGGNGSLVRNRGLYLAGKYGGFSDVGWDGSHTTGEGNPFKTYVASTLTASDTEWLSQDGSTSPSGYFLSNNPDRVINAIKQIFIAASKPGGNLAGGSASVQKVTAATTDGGFYQPKLDITDFSGTVQRTEIFYNTTTQKLDIKIGAVWDASVILTGVQTNTTTLSPLPTPSNRKIFTFNNSTTSGSTFTWTGIDSAFQTALRTDPVSGNDDGETMGQKRLDYLRGVRSDEGTLFRSRKYIFGDIINSAPVRKAGADAGIVDASYYSFYNSMRSRTPTVYVGANDGMLHALYAADSKTDAMNGRELFAYVPRALAGKLRNLTSASYTKDAFVDGSIAVKEARFYRPSQSGIQWGTALVSGMGGGAQGVFALDVTSPSTFSASDVLWEFTDADDADMGNIVGEPRVIKLAVNGAASASPSYKWFVAVTSGYNNYKIDGAQSTSGKQALFLLSLEKDPGTAWSLGTNYFKMVATDPDFSSTTEASGMAPATVATGARGAALFAYAGDLQGNVWRFDLSTGSSDWTSASGKVSRMFLARSAAGVKQAITVAPIVTHSQSKGYQIAFGTGKFLEPSDALPGSAAYQSMYGIWDAMDGKTFQRQPTGAGSTYVNGLNTRTISVTTGTVTSSISVTGPDFFYGTSSSRYRGWFADFSGNMERVSVDPAYESAVLAINSTIPGGDPCLANGASNQYRINLHWGNSFQNVGANNTQGYLGTASLIEVGESKWSKADATSSHNVTRIINSISPGTSGGLTNNESTVNTRSGRISWREIVGFQ